MAELSDINGNITNFGLESNTLAVTSVCKKDTYLKLTILLKMNSGAPKGKSVGTMTLPICQQIMFMMIIQFARAHPFVNDGTLCIAPPPPL